MAHTTDYIALTVEARAAASAVWIRRLGSFCWTALAAVGLATLLGLASLGAVTVITSFPPVTGLATLDAVPSRNAPVVQGNCQCSSSSGAVCCCCSHCGCGADAPQQAQASITESSSGGNWDIDVGGPGVAGGGYCQCNGQCCCCSSCDCTGPGVQVTNSSIVMRGDCNGVANCNGEVPARRKLHARARDDLDRWLVRIRQ